MLNEEVKSSRCASMKAIEEEVRMGRITRRRRRKKRIESVEIASCLQATRSVSSSIECKLDRNKMPSSSGGKLIKFEGKPRDKSRLFSRG